MTPAETAGITVAEIVQHLRDLGTTIAALGVWFFGFVMWGQNRSGRKQADKDREAAQRQADRQAAAAAEDRKAAQAQAAQAATQAAKDRKAMQAQAADDRKVTQGMLAALEELIRRTSPARPGPAEWPAAPPADWPRPYRLIRQGRDGA